MQIITFDKLYYYKKNYKRWKRKLIPNENFTLVARQFIVVQNLVIISTREGILKLDIRKVGIFHVKTKHRELTKKKIKKVKLFS